MSGCLRIDLSTWWHNEWYLIPTISISKCTKGIEINLRILWFTAYATISYIKKSEYES